MPDMPRIATLVITLTLCSVAVAQTSTRGTATVPERFKQFDKDGDGKLSQEEFPYPYFYKQNDKDGDGLLSLEEAAQIKVIGKATPASPGSTTTPTPSQTDADFTPRRHGDEAAKAGLKTDVLAKLDVAMQKAVANKEVSGVIGLIHRNGERGYFEAFGWQDIEAQKALPRDAIFRLKSMSKPVVTVGALVLFDEGKFTLDEPISKHLPEWKEPKVMENGELVSARTQITPRMLMTHSSGLYYQLPGKPAFSGMPPRNENTTLEEYSRSLASQPLLFHPGEKYQYGTSIDVLGRYIEAVSGDALDEFLRERVFEPLRMNDTDFWVPKQKQDRLAQLYSQPFPGTLAPAFERFSPTRPTKLYMGGAGLLSSAEDYERFCSMLMNRGALGGNRVLKSETVDLMFQNHLKPELGQKYGLGGAADGEGSYAWGGANGTQFWLDRTNHLFGIFMVQTQNYRAPTYVAFKQLVEESGGIVNRRGVGALGQSADSAAAMNGLFKQRDQNNDGKLDRDELPAALFDRLDADKDGFVDVEELKALRKPN